jgi:hypothetical protein
MTRFSQCEAAVLREVHVKHYLPALMAHLSRGQRHIPLCKGLLHRAQLLGAVVGHATRADEALCNGGARRSAQVCAVAVQVCRYSAPSPQTLQAV